MSFIFRLHETCLLELVDKCKHLYDLIHSNVVLHVGPKLRTQTEAKENFWELLSERRREWHIRSPIQKGYFDFV